MFLKVEASSFFEERGFPLVRRKIVALEMEYEDFSTLDRNSSYYGNCDKLRRIHSCLIKNKLVPVFMEFSALYHSHCTVYYELEDLTNDRRFVIKLNHML
jgi:hypothetical protein